MMKNYELIYEDEAILEEDLIYLNLQNFNDPGITKKPFKQETRKLPIDLPNLKTFLRLWISRNTSICCL